MFQLIACWLLSMTLKRLLTTNNGRGQGIVITRYFSIFLIKCNSIYSEAAGSTTDFYRIFARLIKLGVNIVPIVVAGSACPAPFFLVLLSILSKALLQAFIHANIGMINKSLYSFFIFARLFSFA